MQAVVETFASYGSGWVLQQVFQVFIKLAKFSRIRGSSYIDLLFRIQESQILITIRNHDDQNCFELCFTAAYSPKHRINLILTDQKKQTQQLRDHNLIHTVLKVPTKPKVPLICP